MIYIAPNLLIGSAFHDSDKRVLDAAGITAVLQLFEGDENWPAHWQALRLPVHDGQPLACELLRRGCEFVQAQRKAGHMTLVACLMGQSRSSTFVFACLLAGRQSHAVRTAMQQTGGLLLADGCTPPEAWRLLKTRHPQAYPHPSLLQSLLECYGLPYSVAELYTLKLETE